VGGNIQLLVASRGPSLFVQRAMPLCRTPGNFSLKIFAGSRLGRRNQTLPARYSFTYVKKALTG
jgi:hypothetical protein